MTRKLLHTELGTRVARIRHRLGLKRYEFAERLGVSRATEGNWEMGQMPRADLLDKIARAGGVTVEWLLHGKEATVKKSIKRQGRPKKGLGFTALDLAHVKDPEGLPGDYVRRYERYAKTLAKRLHRELAEYKKGLLLEFESKRSRATRK